MDIKNNPCLMLLVLFLCFSLKSNLSHEADTISANQSLSGDQTIISAGGVFELGFFKPGNSSNFYIGIWYKKVSLQTIVWVANRDRPISDKYSSELKILKGNLVLLNESQTLIWSTNLYSTTSNLVQAVLLDTGNIVLRDGSDSSEPLWQSFDYPTDTNLPYNKFGLEKRRKPNQLLISWKNSEDPEPGLYSLEPHPNRTSEYFLIWNRSQQYWATGTWNGEAYSLIPEMKMDDFFYNYSYVQNENESYFMYSPENPNFVLSRFMVDASGQLKHLTWENSTKKWTLYWANPRQCKVYAFCGAFGSCNEKSMPFCNCLKGFKPKSMKGWNLHDYSGGCVRKSPLQCGNNSTANGQRDKFLMISSLGLPEHPQFMAVASAMECKSTCLNSCSCSACAYDNSNCSIWFGGLLNLEQLSADDSSGKTLYIRLAASEFSSSNHNRGIVIIGTVVGSIAGVLALLGLVLVVFLRWRRSFKTTKAVDGSLVLFGYRNLQKATKNFSEKLGEGGFGFVFKGTLPDSTIIAVKKLESLSQGEKQFRTEVSMMGTIQHVNLVRLRGFCSEGTKRLLVYDYMSNGSLDAHLFHEKDSKILDWKTRYQIAMGTARGLVYLHEKCRDCIIHCDIKPENILLDADFSPKLADFGLAKLVEREFSRVLTTMRGTRGYLAPEWISGVAVTTKADVYSYGMMLFELISGRRNFEQCEDGTDNFFPIFASRKIAGGEDIISLLDHRLEGNANVEELTRFCRVACWCIQDDETHRPSMGQVLQILEGVSDVNLPPPIPRSLQVLMCVASQEQIIFFT